MNGTVATAPRSFSDMKQNTTSSKSDEEDYALMTISTGPLVEVEATPAILGAVAAYRAAFHATVRLLICWPWKARPRSVTYCLRQTGPDFQSDTR